MEIGIYSLADIGPDPHTGHTASAKERIRDIINAAKLADEAGLDIFGVGEHHRLDYAVSSPPTVLSAISQVTERIRLTSTTTVLNTVDPVRLYEDFATLDLLSDGRAEIIAGRGAFIESFPLFGYDTNHYDELFEEHLQLLLKLNAEDTVTWSGRHRPSLQDAEIAPRSADGSIPIWVGVGGTPESAARAGRYGIGLALAILGGDPRRFKPLVDVYRLAGRKAGHAEEQLKVAVTGHAYIGKTTQEAMEQFYPYYANYWGYVNRQRGMLTRISRADFEEMAAPDTALFVGSPQQIAEKILQQHELYGHQRFIAQMDIGGLPYKQVAQSIERLGAEVVPAVRRALGK